MSFEYSGRTIPDDDAGLDALIRLEANRTLVEDRRDGRPEAQLDWISGMLTVHHDLIQRFEDAYLRLMKEADPGVVRAILDQADQHPSQGGFVHVLVSAIADSSTALSQSNDPLRTDGTTLLGATVRELNRLTSHRASLTPKAASQLAKVDRFEDGWPESDLLLLAFDFGHYSGRLLPTLQRLSSDEEALSLFASAMSNAGPPLSTDGFDLIGRAGGSVRDNFASVLRAFLSSAEQSRQLLLASDRLKDLPPNVQQALLTPRPDPWPDYASRLRVT
ncbi:MAG TPA: hypothetical protein VN947_13805 [Polyangia bacterium]|nr:hypothetical protein [Polyangia bacterium]